MKRWIRRSVVLVLLIAGIVALRLTVFRPRPVPVTVFRAARGVVEEIVTNSKAGTVETRRRAGLSPEVGGRVERLEIREGDRVRSGQLLMQLVTDDARAQVELSRRSLEAARAAEREACLAREQAEREYVRYGRLHGDGVVSEELLDLQRDRRDSAQARCDAARSTVEEAAAAVEVATVQLGKTRLVAPFDGVVTQVSAELGEWITPSPPGVPIPPVIEILDPAAIYVVAPLDEIDVGRVRVGQSVRITLDAYGDRAFAGRLTRVAPFVRDVVDQNRTFDVEAEFDDLAFARTLLPGTSADVEVILETHHDVLRIPTYALMEGGQVLVADGETLVARDVRTGLRNWQFVEIVEGLEPGTPVVVSLDRAEVQAGALATIEGETLQ